LTLQLQPEFERGRITDRRCTSKPDYHAPVAATNYRELPLCLLLRWGLLVLCASRWSQIQLLPTSRAALAHCQLGNIVAFNTAETAPRVPARAFRRRGIMQLYAHTQIDRSRGNQPTCPRYPRIPTATAHWVADETDLSDVQASNSQRSSCLTRTAVLCRT